MNGPFPVGSWYPLSDQSRLLAFLANYVAVVSKTINFDRSVSDLTGVQLELVSILIIIDETDLIGGQPHIHVQRLICA